MPIYEFACQDCGHEFEKIQSFSDSTTPECPNCQGRHVHRRFSPPAIHFKGSGWYITDSKATSKASVTGGKGGEGTAKEGAAKSEGGDAGAAESAAPAAATAESKVDNKADSK